MTYCGRACVFSRIQFKKKGPLSAFITWLLFVDHTAELSCAGHMQGPHRKTDIQMEWCLHASGCCACGNIVTFMNWIWELQRPTRIVFIWYLNKPGHAVNGILRNACVHVCCMDRDNYRLHSVTCLYSLPPLLFWELAYPLSMQHVM